MKKIKVGATVLYNGKQCKVVEKVKGAKTNKPVFHSGVLFNGYRSKPTKYKLSTGDVVFPNQLKSIQA